MTSLIIQINLEDDYCIDNSIDVAIDTVASHVKNSYMHLLSKGCNGIGGPFVNSIGDQKISYVTHLVDNKDFEYCRVFDFETQQPRGIAKEGDDEQW